MKYKEMLINRITTFGNGASGALGAAAITKLIQDKDFTTYELLDAGFLFWAAAILYLTISLVLLQMSDK